MANKPNVKNYDDLKVFITAFAFAVTLGLWNFFSTGAQKSAPSTDPTATQPVDPTPAPAQFAQVKILMGGPPPQTVVYAPPPSAPASAPKPRAQQSAPRPVTRTGSSK